MRRSRYTVEVEGGNGARLLYNTATGTFLVARSEEIADEQALADAGFMTDLSPEEELDAQRAMFEAQRDATGELTLSIAPTYACNFRCPYCYEQGHNSIKGKMSPEVVECIMRFVEERLKARPFEKLTVQWYGGDPSLALDVVEDLSRQLIAFSEERGIEYVATMLTNCNFIDEAAADMLADAHVSSVVVTIDGFEDTHNKRRVSATGSNSFQRNIEAMQLFRERGIVVQANMNVDKVNWPEFHPLRDQLRKSLDVELTCARLCDYGHFSGTRDFKRPEFDLFDHSEYCKLQHDEFVAGGFDVDKVRSLLQPAPRFCNGQRDDYYVIDTLGDIYLCDGYIGEQDHVVANVLDNYSAALGKVSHDPYESEQCRECHLLPICQGNCDWERRQTGMVCHPLLTTLPDYLRDWQRALEDSN